MSKKQTVIHWFRKGLRVHDNPALVRAINEAIDRKAAVRPIFMLDPGIIKWFVYYLSNFRVVFTEDFTFRSFLGFGLVPIAGDSCKKHFLTWIKIYEKLRLDCMWFVETLKKLFLSFSKSGTW